VIFDRLAPDQIVELFVTIQRQAHEAQSSHLISCPGALVPGFRPGHQPRHRPRAQRGQRIAVASRRSSCLVSVTGTWRSPVGEELKGVLTALDAFGGGKQADDFREHATRFFLNYFKQIAKVFPKAWSGKRYSIKTAAALRAFLRVVPDVLSAIRKSAAIRSTPPPSPT